MKAASQKHLSFALFLQIQWGSQNKLLILFRYPCLCSESSSILFGTLLSLKASEVPLHTINFKEIK